MCHTKDTVNMDDGNDRLSVSIEVRSDHPHACVIVWLFRYAAEPVNYSTRISNVVKSERKKAYGSCDFHPTHAAKLVVTVDKNAIIAWCSLEPGRCCPNNLLSHVIGVAQIAWGVKCRNCMVED